MDNLLLNIGRVAGLVGAAAFAIAIVARLLGVFWLAGFQVGTLMQAGVAAMVLGCFSLLLVLAGRGGQKVR